jgi:hypothetical protein
VANQPLDPATAAQLFYSGEPMIYVADPSQPFVYGRWMQQPCISIVPLPFTDAIAYFTQNPVMLASAYVPPSDAAVRAEISVLSRGGRAGHVTKSTGVIEMNLPIGQAVDLTVTFYDAQDNPTAAPGAIAWSSSDDTIASVGESDSDQATVTSVAIGECTITATSGSISAEMDLAVTGSTEAVSAEISAGEPYDTVEAAHAKRQAAHNQPHG